MGHVSWRQWVYYHKMENVNNTPLHRRVTQIDAEISALLSEKEEIFAALKVYDRYTKNTCHIPEGDRAVS